MAGIVASKYERVSCVTCHGFWIGFGERDGLILFFFFNRRDMDMT